jgi:hypothetical protein
MIDGNATLYTLPDLPKTGTTVLTQARNAHGFAITTYASGSTGRKRTKDDRASDAATDQLLVARDLLVVGCRKKVVVFGAGKAGFSDAWVSTYLIGMERQLLRLYVGAIVTSFPAYCYNTHSTPIFFSKATRFTRLDSFTVLIDLFSPLTYQSCLFGPTLEHFRAHFLASSICL